MAKKDSIVKWDEELARMADESAAMVADIGGGKFLSTRGGVLSVGGAPVPGNKMGVVILASLLEHALYEQEYDPDNPSSPTCFAFGKDVAQMSPHKVCVDAGTAQPGPCKGCPKNEFGSADKGRGKACKNVIRIGVISAGQFGPGDKFKLIDDPDYYGKGEVYFMKIPVTSVAGFAAHSKQVKEALKLPLAAIVTKVSLQPDPKSQYKVVFEALSALPKSLIPAVVGRHKEVSASIDFPYQAAEATKGKGKGKKGAAKAQARY